MKNNIFLVFLYFGFVNLVEVEYYVSNKKKYLTFQGTIKKIDYIEKKIIFDNQKSIFIKDIFDIKLLSNEY